MSKPGGVSFVDLVTPLLQPMAGQRSPGPPAGRDRRAGHPRSGHMKICAKLQACEARPRVQRHGPHWHECGPGPCSGLSRRERVKRARSRFHSAPPPGLDIGNVLTWAASPTVLKRVSRTPRASPKAATARVGSTRMAYMPPGPGHRWESRRTRATPIARRCSLTPISVWQDVRGDGTGAWC